MSKDLGYVEYHSRILNNIRAQYVDCSKRKREVNKQLTELTEKLTRFMDGKENLTYIEYIDVKNDIDRLYREDARLDIALAVWDEAREICLNIIYDTGDKEGDK